MQCDLKSAAHLKVGAGSGGKGLDGGMQPSVGHHSFEVPEVCSKLDRSAGSAGKGLHAGMQPLGGGKGLSNYLLVWSEMGLHMCVQAIMQAGSLCAYASVFWPGRAVRAPSWQQAQAAENVRL